MSKSSTAEQLSSEQPSELEQQEAPKSAETAGKVDIGKPGSIEQLMVDAMQGEQGKKNLSKLDQWVNDPEHFEGVGKNLSYFDTCLPMRKFRDWWEQRDHLTQWALMKGTTPPQLWLYNVGPIQALVKFGFIKYKGHYNENEEKMEAEIDKMGGMPDFVAKYGVKFGKYFIPELAGLEPLVEPLMKVQGLENKAIRNIRRSIRRHRARYEKTRLQPVDVVVSTNVKTHGAIEHPSNDNAGARIYDLPSGPRRRPTSPSRPAGRRK